MISDAEEKTMWDESNTVVTESNTVVTALFFYVSNFE